MSPASVRLSSSAARALPRWALLGICIVYAASGLFGRDPWKNEDAAGFGVMWTMAQGHWHDWLLPNLFGKAIPASGPLMYWLGAVSIRLFDAAIDPPAAARLITGLLFLLTCAFIWYGTYLLGRRPEVQPFKYAFGGEPEPRDYGRMLADSAVLILLACFGLAERSHESTPSVAQLACVAMLLYGLIRYIDKPVQGTLWWGSALGLCTLAASPVLTVALLIPVVVFFTIGCITPRSRLVALPGGILLALGIAGLWPLLAFWQLPNNAPAFLREWAFGALLDFGLPDRATLLYALKNFPLFVWPAWPLALWSWYSWFSLRRAPHWFIPFSCALVLLALTALQNQQSNLSFILLLPPLAIAASFALPTLKRGTINAFDWFAVLSFTVLGSFVWLVWIAALTGSPHSIARNVARQVPGFRLEFHLWTLLAALLITLCWFGLVWWRLSRHPKVLWRSVMLSSAGTTLMWVLLMTLWLPLVNYSRTYRSVALQIAAHLPANYACVTPLQLGDAQLASFAYFGKIRFAFDGKPCNAVLEQSIYHALQTESPASWHLVWQGHRPSDRKERFRLFIHP